MTVGPSKFNRQKQSPTLRRRDFNIFPALLAQDKMSIRSSKKHLLAL